MGFQRAARTDKGVSAAGQLVSLKISIFSKGYSLWRSFIRLVRWYQFHMIAKVFCPLEMKYLNAKALNALEALLSVLRECEYRIQYVSLLVIIYIYITYFNLSDWNNFTWCPTDKQKLNFFIVQNNSSVISLLNVFDDTPEVDVLRLNCGSVKDRGIKSK